MPSEKLCIIEEVTYLKELPAEPVKLAVIKTLDEAVLAAILNDVRLLIFVAIACAVNAVVEPVTI